MKILADGNLRVKSMKKALNVTFNTTSNSVMVKFSSSQYILVVPAYDSIPDTSYDGIIPMFLLSLMSIWCDRNEMENV